MRKFPRTEVYKALDSERDYQDKRWNPKTTRTGGEHSASEWLAYMEDYIDEAQHILARESDEVAMPKVMNIVRKVTAMGVVCMEEHGAPPRNT